jgi:hypothetical protein
MQGNNEDTNPSASALLPPATTRWQPLRPAAGAREPRIAPPFVVRTPSEVTAEPQTLEPPPRATEPEPTRELSWESAAPATQTEAAPDAEPLSQAVLPELEIESTWEELQEEGTVRPAFEADSDAALEAFTFEATELARKDDFPLEAFIVPEQAQRIPSGMEGKPIPAQPESTPVTSLADRLEKLSHRLRVEDTEIIIRRLASGDRLDTMLAGLLAGYLAGTSEQS